MHKNSLMTVTVNKLPVTVSGHSSLVTVNIDSWRLRCWQNWTVDSNMSSDEPCIFQRVFWKIN